MAFRVEQEGNFNPFEWPDMACPVCKGGDFTSISHAAVHCDGCNAEFRVRTTAGDPGCVVDCLVKQSSIYAPSWHCTQCDSKSGGYFDWEEPICSENSGHKMERREGISSSWTGKKNAPRYYYLILKTGDYCSGWLPNNHLSRSLGFPTQKQWEHFQQNYHFVRELAGPGVAVARFNPRTFEFPKGTDYRAERQFLEKYQSIFEQVMRESGIEAFKILLELVTSKEGKLLTEAADYAPFEQIFQQKTSQNPDEPMMKILRTILLEQRIFAALHSEDQTGKPVSPRPRRVTSLGGTMQALFASEEREHLLEATDQPRMKTLQALADPPIEKMDSHQSSASNPHQDMGARSSSGDVELLFKAAADMSKPQALENHDEDQDSPRPRRITGKKCRTRGGICLG